MSNGTKFDFTILINGAEVSWSDGVEVNWVNPQINLMPNWIWNIHYDLMWTLITLIPFNLDSRQQLEQTSCSRIHKYTKTGEKEKNEEKA